jgi:hypothetical protein
MSIRSMGIGSAIVGAADPSGPDRHISVLERFMREMDDAHRPTSSLEA